MGLSLNNMPFWNVGGLGLATLLTKKPPERVVYHEVSGSQGYQDM